MSKDLAISVPDTSISGPVSKIVDWLNDNYDIVVDEMDPGRIFITGKDDSRAITFDELYLRMVDSGEGSNDNLLRRILRCEGYFKSVNPVREYLIKLKGKYNGKSHIDLLCTHLEARDFGDKTKKYYQERANNLLRKWIVATAACALGHHYNDVALGFVHDVEGIGKTYLTKFICPKPLYHYYQKVDPNYAQKDGLSDMFSRNFIVNFDELVGISARRPEDFKQIMTAETCSIKLPRDPFPKTVPRIASAVFTSNRNAEKGGFITSAMGHRRFGVIELSGINHEYSQIVDVDQIWAEAMMLIDESFNFIFNDSDWAEFNEYNTKYFIDDIPTIVIRSNYMIPDPEETQPEFYKNASQIYIDILRNKMCKSEHVSKLNPKVIGNALTQLGFNRTSKRVPGHTSPMYVYHIKNISI